MLQDTYFWNIFSSGRTTLCPPGINRDEDISDDILVNFKKGPYENSTRMVLHWTSRSVFPQDSFLFEGFSSMEGIKSNLEETGKRTH